MHAASSVLCSPAACMYMQGTGPFYNTTDEDILYKVEPLIKHKGHNRSHLHSKDTFRGPKFACLLYNTFVTSKNGQKTWYQCVLYLEVPLHTKLLAAHLHE